MFQVTGGMEGEVRVWNIGFQTQTMDASLKETGMVTLSKGEGIVFFAENFRGLFWYKFLEMIEIPYFKKIVDLVKFPIFFQMVDLGLPKSFCGVSTTMLTGASRTCVVHQDCQGRHSGLATEDWKTGG